MLKPVPDADSTSQGWRRRDAWTGLMFLAVGGLLGWYAVLAYGNGMPLALWGAAALLGPLLALLGTNAVIRSLLSAR